MFNSGRMYRGDVTGDADPFHRPSGSPTRICSALEKILRSCVHCGFCTATCPTYLLTGDERESPRGRIYLIKDLLESGRSADGRGRRADRPLPVVPLLHDHLPVRRRLPPPRRPCPRRDRDDATGGPLADRLMRAALARLLPSRALFRAGLALAALGRPFAPIAGARSRASATRLAAMLALAPQAPAARRGDGPGEFSRRRRAPSGAASRCSTGCAQQGWRRRSTRRPSAC